MYRQLKTKEEREVEFERILNDFFMDNAIN